MRVVVRNIEMDARSERVLTLDHGVHYMAAWPVEFKIDLSIFPGDDEAYALPDLVERIKHAIEEEFGSSNVQIDPRLVENMRRIRL